MGKDAFDLADSAVTHQLADPAQVGICGAVMVSVSALNSGFLTPLSSMEIAPAPASLRKVRLGIGGEPRAAKVVSFPFSFFCISALPPLKLQHCLYTLHPWQTL